MKCLFVTGKGGVGKSAVTAALAMTLAGRGQRVAVIELGQNRLGDFWGETTPAHLRCFNLQPGDCFEEYAARHLSARWLFFLKNRWVHHFVDAAPGLKEILLLGKMVSLSAEGPFDQLLVDAPATGHTLALLEAPRLLWKTMRGGPLKTTLENILDWLHTAAVRFWVVTQLEEAIVEETLRLTRELNRLDKKPDRLLINAHQPWLPAPPVVPSAPKPLRTWLAFLECKQRVETKLWKKMERQTKLPAAELPWCGGAPSEPAICRRLAEVLSRWL